jgi:tRNA 2-thiouridine synthesizing protein E
VLFAHIELEMNSQLIMPDGGSLGLDEDGHLDDPKEWSRAAAECFSAEDNISLTAAHWLVLEILRDYFRDFGIEPPMRALVKEMKARGSEEIANSLDLYRLFPEGPVRQGSRYAGLPLPLSCI